MLISRKHKFVFIHIYKTAGTSVARALLPFTVSRPKRKTVHLLKQLRLPYPEDWDPGMSVEHKTAAEARQQLGHELFENVFSFAFVRNPWDWQVSFYHYVLANHRHQQHDLMKRLGSFEQYVHWLCDDVDEPRDDRCQSAFVCDHNGQQLVDFVGKFEDLETDFSKICQQIGVNAKLPRLNTSHADRDYRRFYSDWSAELIAHKYAEDIDRFGYCFEATAQSLAAALIDQPRLNEADSASAILGPVY